MVINSTRRGFIAALASAAGLYWYFEQREQKSHTPAVPAGGVGDKKRADVSDWLFVGVGETHTVESDEAERHSGVTLEPGATLTIEEGGSITVTA